MKKLREIMSAVLCCIAAAFMPVSAADAVNKGDCDIGKIAGVRR